MSPSNVLQAVQDDALGKKILEFLFIFIDLFLFLKKMDLRDTIQYYQPTYSVTLLSLHVPRKGEKEVK